MYNFLISKIASTFVFLLLFSFAALAQVDAPRRTTAITYPLDEQVW